MDSKILEDIEIFKPKKGSLLKLLTLAPKCCQMLITTYPTSGSPLPDLFHLESVFVFESKHQTCQYSTWLPHQMSHLLSAV